MNTDNLTQELDRLMMEEGYIEVSDKNDMIAFSFRRTQC